MNTFTTSASVITDVETVWTGNVKHIVAFRYNEQQINTSLSRTIAEARGMSPEFVTTGIACTTSNSGMREAMMLREYLIAGHYTDLLGYAMESTDMATAMLYHAQGTCIDALISYDLFQHKITDGLYTDGKRAYNLLHAYPDLRGHRDVASAIRAALRSGEYVVKLNVEVLELGGRFPRERAMATIRLPFYFDPNEPPHAWLYC